MVSSFPFEGTFEAAPLKKFEETVFFIHFFEGSKVALKRHIELVKGFGFDTFAFNLEDKFSLWKPPISSEGQIGLKHIFADQCEELLNLLPGKKIIYAFSNPAAGAIEAMARRRNVDTVALITDSGPAGPGFFLKSAYSLLVHEKHQNSLVAFATAPLLSMGWSPKLHNDLIPQLNSFPEHFPVLSIRGWKDPLIPPEQIDAVFNGHPNLDWQKLALPEAGHLNGLRDFPNDYVPPVKKFLEQVATRIKE